MDNVSVICASAPGSYLAGAFNNPTLMWANPRNSRSNRLHSYSLEAVIIKAFIILYLSQSHYNSLRFPTYELCITTLDADDLTYSRLNTSFPSCSSKHGLGVNVLFKLVEKAAPSPSYDVRSYPSPDEKNLPLEQP
ncbi:hypothetical protein GMJAKD_03235 [Candidatus Electrothrix aarhusensis]